MPISKLLQIKNTNMPSWWKICILILIITGAIFCLSSRSIGVPNTIPKVFDQASIQDFIDHADEKNNANLLKYVYFANRRHQTYSKEEAGKLLNQAIHKFAPGSDKWFILQSIYAFGMFYVNEDFRNRGYQAYGDMFYEAQVPDFDIAKHAVILRTVVGDFVKLQSTPFGANETSGIASVLLQQAMSIYLIVRDVSGLHLPWGAAVKITGDGSKLIDITDKELIKTKDPSYFVLTTAASVRLTSKPDSAIDLLKRAKLKLHTSDKKECQQFYNTLSDCLVSIGNNKDAVLYLNEEIKNSNTGQGKLVILYFDMKDQKSFRGLITELKQSDAPEDEIIYAANQLLTREHMQSGNNAGTSAEDLLNAYLKCQRTRTISNELMARFLLGNWYLNTNKSDEARSVLNIKDIVRPIGDPLALNTYRAIERLNKQLDNKATDASKQQMPETTRNKQK